MTLSKAEHHAASVPFFVAHRDAETESLVPLPSANSQWGGTGGQLRGMAVSGALARATENAVTAALSTGQRLRPVRWTVDLYRAAAFGPSATSVHFVRRGRRLCVVDAVLEQGGRDVARSRALFMAPGDSPAGAVWEPEPARIAPPPRSMCPDTDEPRLYYSDGVGWTGSPDPHATPARKATWHFPAPLVEGESPSPFQLAAMAADVVNVVCNWGAGGLEFINADFTLVLARLPGEGELGLVADQRAEEDGLAVGSAVVFDRAGTLGTVVASGLANGTNAVDPTLFRRNP
ncbi:thioesterase family protein [Amycolatopsis sp. K13G38]|uniref:Thioesterase family protein n=1 Tax=Amycolatopsis acididurans TaxID=2724524 RepID=A0ABX1JAV4_9PSEU|nr:acyl-CoA thioesterase domain-containing protein [Amycolatopsis acididurans]NKQ55546.1 thioesterase family protein [Amycolatopsis acididurans]